MVQRRRVGEGQAGRLGWSLLCAVGVNTLSLLVGLLVLPRFISVVGPGRRAGRLGLALIQIVTTISTPRPMNPPTI